MNTQTLDITKPKLGVKLRDLTAGDPWADSPFYGFGNTSENIMGLEKGVAICGVLHGLRTSNKKLAENLQRDYAVMKTPSGELFRLFTPGQLTHILGTLDLLTYVEIIWKGKEYVESRKAECHQFDVRAGDLPVVS